MDSKLFMRCMSFGMHEYPDLVKDYIAEGGNVNIKDDKGNTPLILAALYECWDDVRLLLDAGADIAETENSYSRNALDYACLSITDVPDDVFSRLLRNDLVNRYDKLGAAPIHLAAFRGDVKRMSALICAGADVNLKKKESSETPLVIAFANENYDVAKLLVDDGAKLVLPDGTQLFTDNKPACDNADWLDRVKKERDDLRVKIDKLEDFLKSNASFSPESKIIPQQHALLQMQAEVMGMYYAILIRRIGLAMSVKGDGNA